MRRGAVRAAREALRAGVGRERHHVRVAGVVAAARLCGGRGDCAASRAEGRVEYRGCGRHITAAAMRRDRGAQLAGGTPAARVQTLPGRLRRARARQNSDAGPVIHLAAAAAGRAGHQRDEAHDAAYEAHANEAVAQHHVVALHAKRLRLPVGLGRGGQARGKIAPSPPTPLPQGERGAQHSVDARRGEQSRQLKHGDWSKALD